MNTGTKRFFAVAALALMIPAVAAASVARMAGLNVPGDYVKGEYTGMFTYLSEVNAVGNMAYVEAGSTYDDFADHAVGAVIPGLFGSKYGTWAVNLRQVHPALGGAWNYEYINTRSGGGYDPNYAGEAFDLLWGYKMGSGNLGLRINRSYTSFDDGTNTVEGDGNGGRNILGFGAGYDFEMNANTTVELGGLYQQRSWKNSATVKDNGGTAMLLAARAMRKASGNLVLIPAAKFYSIDNSYTSGSTDYDNKLSGWQAGFAGNWTVGSDDLLVFGANFAGNKETYNADAEDSEIFMPNVFLALETHLNPWLTFRAGAQNAMFYSQKNKSGAPVTTDTYKEHVFSFNFGTSVKMGNLTFDATLDPAFLQNPIAQLMGGSNAFFYNNYYSKGPARPSGYNYDAVFPQVSATYTW